MKMKNINQYKVRLIRPFKLFALALICFVMPSCEDFLEIGDPVTEVNSNKVFKNKEAAVTALRGIYRSMYYLAGTSSFSNGGSSSTTFLAGFSADEFDNLATVPQMSEFYANAIQPNNSSLKSMWSTAYNYIFNANALLEGASNSSSLEQDFKDQLRGEALFIRAFCHFYMAALFGDVPIITSTDYDVNRLAPRSATSEVYAQIIADLKEAEELLAADYAFSNDERIQSNKGAARALLARTYLYMEDWFNAELYATKVIDDTQYELLPDLNSVFLANSRESIWQLQPPEGTGSSTNESEFFIPYTPPPTYIALTDVLMEAFEDPDARLTNWVGSISDGSNIWYYPYKYKDESGNLLEYSMVLRLAEQFLIRAEARAQQGELPGARVDINTIRERAGLPNTEADSQSAVLAAIEQERRIELFSEWGHRWLDLRRTNRIDDVLSPLKSDWQSTDALYPIPESELETGPNLTQNPGY